MRLNRQYQSWPHPENRSRASKRPESSSIYTKSNKVPRERKKISKKRGVKCGRRVVSLRPQQKRCRLCADYKLKRGRL